MAQAWVQTADGRQALIEVTQLRGGNAESGLALGCVPVVANVEVAAQTIADDDQVSIIYSPALGAQPGDAVIVNAISGETPGNDLYGLTIGPCCVTGDGAVQIDLQNRTADPIVIAEAFYVRLTVIKVLPAPPALP